LVKLSMAMFEKGGCLKLTTSDHMRPSIGIMLAMGKTTPRKFNIQSMSFRKRVEQRAVARMSAATCGSRRPLTLHILGQQRWPGRRREWDERRETHTYWARRFRKCTLARRDKVRS
jgi:hypothetical protein